jgi:hypothetical protein
MTSTRNRNTYGDYELQHSQSTRNFDHNVYVGSFVNSLLCHPSDGVGHAKMHSKLLSSNNVDIESELFGVGSTNLVQKKEKVSPKLHNLQSLSIYDRSITVVLPEPLIVYKNQRYN